MTVEKQIADCIFKIRALRPIVDQALNEGKPKLAADLTAEIEAEERLLVQLREQAKPVGHPELF